MKNLFLALVLCCTVSVASALTIDNYLSCAVQIKLVCGDQSGCDQGCTKMICIDGNTLGTVVPICMADCPQWNIAYVCPLDGPTCPNPSCLAPSDCSFVSWNGCQGLPNQQISSFSPCFCSSMNVDWTVWNNLVISP